MRGAREVRKVLIEELPRPNIDIIVIWIDMLAGDNENTATKSSEIFQNTSVRQFHDPNRLIGKAIAESLGSNKGIAWDIYLFYKKENLWKETPPQPLYWLHQLDDLWAGIRHYAWGNDLPVKLREIKNTLITN